MARARELSSFDILEEEGLKRGGAKGSHASPDAQDFEDHMRTYRSFLHVIMISIAFLAVLLLAMAYFLVR